MSMTATPPTPDPPPTPRLTYNHKRDWWIPWTFVAAFLLLFAVDGTLAYLAISTQPGVVVEHSYERGLNYNLYLAEAEAQAKRGWQSQTVLNDKTLRFTLQDKDGQPLTGATVTAQMIRPLQDGADFNVTLEESAPGVYISQVSFPFPGNWDARISATWQNQPYHAPLQQLDVR